MRERRGRRRRSKLLWLREYDRREIHALAGHLSLKRWEEGLTDKQEWLWDQIIVELAWRASHASVMTRCTCLLCCQDDRHTAPPRSDEPWGEWPDEG